MHLSFETVTFKEVKKQRRHLPSVFPWKEVHLSVHLELCAVAVSHSYFDRKDSFLLTYLALS